MRAGQTIIATAADDVGTPPANADIVVGQTEELDEGGDGHTGGESSRQDEVVLRPQGEPALADKEPGESTDGNSRPHVRHVVRGPLQGTSDRDNRVNVADSGAIGELLSDKPVDKNNDNAEGKANQGGRVCATNTPKSLGTNSSPENRSSEESVVARAVKTERRIRRADTFQMNLELKDTNVNKSGHERGYHLCEEGEAGSNLDIMRKLEIIAESQCVGTGNVAVRLEETHGKSVTFDKRAANELCEDVESNFNTSHSVNNTDRNDKEKAHDNAVEDDRDRSVSGIGGDTCAADSNGKDQSAHVPPLGNFLVCLHKTVMNIKNAAFLDLVLLGGTEAVDDATEAHHDLCAVE